MNKYIVWAVFLQLVISTFSHPIYTIEQVPLQHHNYYHITYQLTGHELLVENAILEENIITLSSNDFKKSEYYLEYHYNQYQNKQNYFSFESLESYIRSSHQLLTDQFFNVLDYNDCHPSIFYLHNLRSGLLSESPKIGHKWSTRIIDNKHTYLSSNQTISPKYAKDLKIQYEVKDIGILKDARTPSHRPFKIYKIAWNALNFINNLTRRNGEIKITSDGIIQSLLIYLPEQLQKFNLVDHHKLIQPSTLLIERIPKATYEKILKDNPFLLYH